MFKKGFAAVVAVLTLGFGIGLGGWKNIAVAEQTSATASASLNCPKENNVATNVCTGYVVKKNKDSFVLRSEKDQQLLQINYSPELEQPTQIYTAKQGKLSKTGYLKVGDHVKVIHDCRLSRSLPPQALGYVIVKGKAGEQLPKYLQVKDVNKSVDGAYVEIVSDDEELIATIDAKACQAYASIQAGDKLLLWYSYMTMSLPARTNAVKAVIIK